MSTLTVDELIRKIDQLNKDIKALEDEDPLVLFPHLFTDNAKLIQAAGINILSSRKQNLLAQLRDKIDINI